MTERLWAKGLALDEALHRFTVGEDPVTDLALLPYDAQASAAHARMLGEAGLLPPGEARALVAELERLQALARAGGLAISPQEEDCHTALEGALTAALGETGRRIHLGRSRNDQVATALRLLMREEVLALGEAALAAATAFLDLAEAHEEDLLPGYTHLRRAMPATWGMWGASYAEGILEDLEALPALWDRLDRCPLGAAAGYGAPLPLDRARSAALLGFSRVQRSPMDVMNARGRHEGAILAWLTSLAGTLEKALWDLGLYSTEEFGFVRLPDAFTTGSSLMPQKRNPDVLELARARCRELRGLAGLVSGLGGGLPGGYHRDLQLLKKPFLEALGKGRELLDVVARLVPGLELRLEACGKACTPELHAAQEACLLAASGLPFRDAYRIVAERIQAGTFQGVPRPSAPHEGAPGRLGLEASREALEASSRWIRGRRDHLDRARLDLYAWPPTPDTPDTPSRSEP